MKLRNRFIAAMTALAIPMTVAPAAADSTYGWIERMRIEPWGVEVSAKLDTGARTSSIHATGIDRFERDGQEWVRFTVSITDENRAQTVRREFERPLFRNIVVRGAGGMDRRPVVLMNICAGDGTYEEQFSLNDRSDMLYPVLIGRRTIKHLGVVDVTRTFLSEPTCGTRSHVQVEEDAGKEDVEA